MDNKNNVIAIQNIQLCSIAAYTNRFSQAIYRQMPDRVPVVLSYQINAMKYDRLEHEQKKSNNRMDYLFSKIFECDGYYQFDEHRQTRQNLSLHIRNKLNSLNYLEVLRDAGLYNLFYESVIEYSNSILNNSEKEVNSIHQDQSRLQLNQQYIIHPLDFILENYMTFSELITTIRKDPQKICVIIDVLAQILLENLSMSQNDMQPTYYTMVMTMPTFLNSQTFREFYYPFLNEVCKLTIASGDVLSIFMQRDCSQHYQSLSELPDNKGNIILIAEGYNLKLLKNVFGDKMCIGGGLTSNLLDYASKEECKDEVKRLIDECAPDGGFVLCNPTILSNPSTASIINLEAAIQVAKEYESH